MTPNRQLILGKTLVVFGCVWFFLALFRIPPLFWLLFVSFTWLRLPTTLPDMLLTAVYGREYIMALAIVAFGATVWRHALVPRWPLKAIFLVLSLTLVGAAIHYEVKSEGRKKREAFYQMTLRSYSDVLKPGMTRKEVEGYLRTRNSTFTQMCCVEARKLSERSSLDDLVKIGKEDPPWFCGENNVYIAFQFNDHEQTRPGLKANDLDILKSVAVYPWLENCL